MAGYDSYLENQVLTATPEQLHLMVVDGAIRFARQAELALVNDESDMASQAISRARDFVGELISGLNPEPAPDLTADVGAIFLFVYRQLSLVEVERNPQMIRDAISILETHRETWLALMHSHAHKPHIKPHTPAAQSSETEATPPRSWSA